MTPVYALFHLNLAYSSIEEEMRGEVIERCYWPLLELIREQSLPLGIELTGWTLKQIQARDPAWVATFRSLLQEKRCELVGSGYCQIIGPLVPYEVNRWNQRLGLECYQELLGTKPRLALVNEMAFSSGMVGIYRQAGYEGIIMDRDNICLARGIDSDMSDMPGFADGGDGQSLAVLWSDSIMFQKLQRYAHGDITLDDYQHFFAKRASELTVPLALYANDAEIFDFRPGRYKTESDINRVGEWQRIANLFDGFQSHGVQWLLPSQALAHSYQGRTAEAGQLVSISQPIPVKKQAKYNVSRWAVTGRNDLWLNTMCHRLCTALLEKGAGSEAWRNLCELWASDVRTHITAKRWQMIERAVQSLAKQYGVACDYKSKTGQSGQPLDLKILQKAGYQAELDEEGIFLEIKSVDLDLRLNLRRGLAIDSLAFHSHAYEPVIGTLPHGYFHSIELGADFYSGGTVVELLKLHHRVTDLNWVTPTYTLEQGELTIHARIESDAGVIDKHIHIAGETITLTTSFPDWLRPFGTVRVNTLTLLPDAFDDQQLQLQVTNGGQKPESFAINQPCNHARPASTLVSASGGFGATTGKILVGDQEKAIQLSWDPAKAAVFPMLFRQDCSPASLNRLFFSLAEIDETCIGGGELPSFSLTIAPSV